MNALFAVFLATLIDPIQWLVAIIGTNIFKGKARIIGTFILMIFVNEIISSILRLTYSFPHTHHGQILGFIAMIVICVIVNRIKNRSKD